MKRYSHLGAVILTLILLLFSISVVAAQVKDFALTLRGPTGTLKSGSQIRLRITVTNHSGHDLTFARSGGQEDDLRYDIEVRDATGRNVSSTDYLGALREDRAIIMDSTVAFTLKPGNSFVDEIEITRFYKMNRPGKYKLRVTRTTSEVTARSNIVTITVVK